MMIWMNLMLLKLEQHINHVQAEIVKLSLMFVEVVAEKKNIVK